MADLTQDTVEYQILLEATKAVQDLEKLTASATTVDEKMRLTAVAVADFGEKLGISLPVAEALFRRVEQAAAQLQITLSELAKQNMTMPLGPLQQQLAATNPIFPAAEGTPVSPEMWKGVHIQIQQMNQEMERFNELVRQTNVNLNAAAMSAAGIKIPIKSAADTMASLQTFAGSQQGQGILSTFLLGYQGANGMTEKITAIKTAILQMSQQSGASFQQVGNLLKTSFNIPDVQVSNAIKTLNKELGNVPMQAEKAVRSIDAIRIALGAIVAMIVFNVIQGFTQFFSGAIQQAKELQGALYNLTNAERIMSEQGIAITPTDLKETIDDLQRLVPIISNIDATKAVSSIALFTKDLGYTKDQVKDLTDAIGVLFVRNRSLGLSFEQVRSQVLTGLLTGRAQGIRDLGVSISESQIQNEALREGLVKTDKEFKALTGDIETQVKAQAMLGIITRNTAEEQKSLGEFMQTPAARMDKFSAAVANFKTLAGQAFLPLVAALADVGTNILKTYQTYQRLAAFFTSTLVTSMVTPFIIVSEAIQGHIKSVDDLRGIYDKTFNSINGWIREHVGITLQSATAMDTATGSADKLTTSLVDMSQVDLSSLENSLQSIRDRISDLNRDFGLKNENYIQDQNIKMQRMQQDYQDSVQQTIQDFNNRRADSEAQYRNQQLDAEAKYQEQLRELRARYLFDLEDALRARDARQVLRLQAQYRMDKSNLENNFKIESDARARQHAEELAQLRRNEQQKLAEMAKAEAIKESRAQQDFARDQAMRQQEYENQLSDLKRSWDERLSEEANKLAEEYGLDEKGAAAIKTLLEKYYGKGGVFDGLYTGSLNSLKTKGSAMLAEMANIIMQYQALASSIGGMFVGTMPGNEPYRGGGGTYNGTTPSTGGGGGSSWSSNENVTSNRRAKGGIDFATKPTSLTFGDAGPEMAITLPLGKSLADVPSNMPAPAGAQSLGGIIQLMIDLNPDLEVRIMDNTLKEAAQITTNVYRRRS